MTSRLAELLGVQLPRVEHRPPAVAGSWGAEVAELSARCGVELDPWQRHVLDVGLAEGPDGLFAALEVALVVPRQNGKSAVLAALAVAAPFIFDAQLVLFSAHEFKTTLEAYALASRMVQEGPLKALHLKDRRSGAETGIEFRNGARIRFVARSRSSGRGFSADLVILDEAFSLQRAQLGALLPTLSSRPNPQVWLASSAPMHDSEALHRVRARAVSDSPGRLAYMEWSVEVGTALDDRAAWAQANPALGSRLTERFIETELDAMPAREFERERLGIGDAPEGEVEAGPIDAEQWSEQVDRAAQHDGPLVYGIDVKPDGTKASVGVAGARAGGGFLVEVIETRRGTRWVPQFLVEVVARNGGDGVAVDPGSAAGALIPDLEAAGLVVHKLGARQHAQACGALAARVPTGEMFHLGQPELDDAVAGARKRTLGRDGAWLWDRADAGAEIMPLVCVTLAFGALLTLEPEPVEQPSVYEDRGFVEW